MRMMVDTNVLISAVYNPRSTPARAVFRVCSDHTLVLCDYIIAECYDVLWRHFPEHIPMMDKLMAELSFETAIAPREPSSLIADPKDAPILNAAIVAEVDFIISGDGHFLRLNIERPRVLTPAAYLEHADDMASM